MRAIIVGVYPPAMLDICCEAAVVFLITTLAIDPLPDFDPVAPYVVVSTSSLLLDYGATAFNYLPESRLVGAGALVTLKLERLALIAN